MRRAGTGPDATPEVLGTETSAIGQNFTDLFGSQQSCADNQFVTDIGRCFAQLSSRSGFASNGRWSRLH